MSYVSASGDTGDIPDKDRPTERKGRGTEKEECKKKGVKEKERERGKASARV